MYTFVYAKHGGCDVSGKKDWCVCCQKPLFLLLPGIAKTTNNVIIWAPWFWTEQLYWCLHPWLNHFKQIKQMEIWSYLHFAWRMGSVQNGVLILIGLFVVACSYPPPFLETPIYIYIYTPGSTNIACNGKWTRIEDADSYWKRWFSIAMLVYQRVTFHGSSWN